jgi:hypothetical protein
MRSLILISFSLLLAACGAPAGSPEEALREWLARGEIAAEERDRGELLDMISEDYADTRGNDRERVGDLLRVYFFRQHSIALLTNIDDISISGETAAIINLTIGMAGTNSSALGR